MSIVQCCKHSSTPFGGVDLIIYAHAHIGSCVHKKVCTLAFHHSDDRAAAQLKMSLKTFLLVLVIAAAAHSQPAQNFDHAEFRRCTRVSVEQICTDNRAYVNDLLETLVNCRAAEPARYAATFCARDEQAGLYCGAAEAYSVDFGVAQFFCNSTIQGDQQCTDECRDWLTSIRNDLGCCVNTFFNNTLILGAIFGDVLNNSLWADCNVPLPSATCDGELPFTLPDTPSETCTFDEYEACREGDFNVLKASLAGEPASCDVVVQYNLDRCSRMPESDDACLLGLGTDTLTPQDGIQAIAYNCYFARATESCSSSCRDSLQTFTESRGCCINTLYNSTYALASGLNFTIPYFQDTVLFDLCEIDAPPLTCESGSLPLKAFALTMLLPLIVALLGNN